MSDYGFAVQTAVFEALKNASPPIAGGSIFDHVPQTNTPFPHVEIGEVQAITDDTSGDDEGVSENLDLHIWSRYRGKKEIDEVASRIHDVLHEASLTVPGRTSAFAWVRNKRVFRDPDGVTRHGILALEIIHRS